ncbi:hypothetical protein AB0957_36625, partial [Streptomyces zhihengii]|uniref:hypothetical protein n=1 Tax=Streptomyces zhihengii TaxID=1818004 RepID=UPI003451836E
MPAARATRAANSPRTASGAPEAAKCRLLSAAPLLLDRADRVVLLHEGEVAAVGSHRELLETE